MESDPASKAAQHVADCQTGMPAIAPGDKVKYRTVADAQFWPAEVIVLRPDNRVDIDIFAPGLLRLGRVKLRASEADCDRGECYGPIAEA